MVALQIRHVPDDVRDTLTAEADQRGQSLQTYLLDVITREAAAARNRRLAHRWLTQPTPVQLSVDVSELISRQRVDREQQLTDAVVDPIRDRH